MTTLLICIAFLAGPDEAAVREQVDAVIRQEYSRESLDKLAKMAGAGGIITKMIEDGDRRIVPLISILGAIKATESEDFLVRMLKHFKDPVRVGAACALAKLESKKATDGTIALLRDAQIEEDDR